MERDGEEKRCVRVFGNGLKMSGPIMDLDEGFESRRGGVNTEEIANRDFHSSEKSIVFED